LQKLKNGNAVQIAEPGPGNGEGEGAGAGSVLVVRVMVQVPSLLRTTLTDTLLEPLPELDELDDTEQPPFTCGTTSTLVVVSAKAAPEKPAAMATTANIYFRFRDFMVFLSWE
jgi:hypothetical protein